MSKVHQRYSQTDERRKTSKRATAYSERERELTFAKNYTVVAHYTFHADQPIFIILAGNSFGVLAIISLLNFSRPFAITFLVCCETATLYKAMVKAMGNDKFRHPKPDTPSSILMKFKP